MKADELGRGVLNTADIVFMVMAAAAPMAVVVALMPMAFAFGNGAGVPGTYACAVISMLLFAVGYVRIVPHVKNAGAFYAYISAGFGRALGLGAAYVAALSYFALACSTIGAFAFFTQQFVHDTTGSSVHWTVWAFLCIALVGFLAYHRIALAAAVLAYALLAEVLLILLLDFAIIKDVGPGGFDLADFAPSRVIAPGLGVAAIYAFNSLIGVEGTAIYQEEARNPARSVPRATYIAVVLVGLFYVFTAWCLTSSGGAAHLSAIAKQNPGEFIGGRSLLHMGPLGARAISLLVLTSSLAAVLGLFNNATRYLYALGRDGVLPRRLARTHAQFQSPHVAATFLTVMLLLVFSTAAVAHLDPLLNVATALVGLGSVGLMALMAVTAIAIPVFFARRGSFGWTTSVAPAVGGIVIAVSTVLAFVNYQALTGVSSYFINHLPYVLLLVAVVGICQATWLRANRSNIYLQIGSSRVEER